MTDDEIAKLRALCEAALAESPGPWEIDWNDKESGTVNDIRDAGFGYVLIADSGVYPPGGPVAELIAATATALPAALDEIERLRQELSDARAVIQKLWSTTNA